MNLSDNMNTIFEQLRHFFTTETVIGQPIQVGNITLIPVISVSFGVGNGIGSGKDEKGNDGQGGGAGAGGKITPNAIVVINNGEVSVLPLSGRNTFDKIAELIPEIISKAHKAHCCEKEEEE